MNRVPSDLTVFHSPSTGTIVRGTQLGDSSAAVLRVHGLKWSHTQRCWYLPGSRGSSPSHHFLEGLEAALSAAGAHVGVQLSPRPFAIAGGPS